MMLFIKNILKNSTVVFSLRILLGAVFIYASVDKIEKPWQFMAIIEGYDLTPGMLSYYLALFLPFLELICGLFLIGGKYVRGSAAIISALLLLFIGAISLALWHGLESNCGCFSLSGKGEAISFMRILEDLILLIVSLIILLFYKPVVSPVRENTVK